MAEKEPSDIIKISNLSAYLDEYDETLAYLIDVLKARESRRCDFPHTLMALLGYDLMDMAKQWCQDQWGPGGDTYEDRPYQPQENQAFLWLTCWMMKTEYDYGFCEWYFREPSHLEQFVAHIQSCNEHGWTTSSP